MKNAKTSTTHQKIILGTATPENNLKAFGFKIELLHKIFAHEEIVVVDENNEYKSLCDNFGLARITRRKEAPENILILGASGSEKARSYIIPHYETDLRDTIVFGKSASGKTTQLILMLKVLLKQHPGLKVGVCEKSHEIKSAVPEVTSVHSLSEDFDLLVIDCTGDEHMLKEALSLSVPVWCECFGSKERFAENDILGLDDKLPQFIYMDSFVPSVLS